jgi:hypothetical protein
MIMLDISMVPYQRRDDDRVQPANTLAENPCAVSHAG